MCKMIIKITTGGTLARKLNRVQAILFALRDVETKAMHIYPDDYIATPEKVLTRVESIPAYVTGALFMLALVSMTIITVLTERLLI